MLTDERVLAATRAVIDGRKITVDAMKAALQAQGVADLPGTGALTAVLGVNAFAQALRRRRGPLPDVTVEVRHSDPTLAPADLAAAMNIWNAIHHGEGSFEPIEHPYREPLNQLRVALQALRSPPVIIAHPLSRLVDALEGRNAPAAYLYLRDSAEGLVRLGWLLLVGETLDAAGAEEDLRALDDAGRRALGDLMERVAKRSFSFGEAVRILAGTTAKGRDSVLARLCAGAWRVHLTHSTALDDALSNDLRKHLNNLRDWRNKDVGHGIIGTERRLHRLLRNDDHAGSNPIDDLATLLDALGPWLDNVGAWAQRHGWPAALGTTADGPGTPAPDPIAWLGGGAPLWVLDSLEPESLLVLDVLAGGGTRRKQWTTKKHVAALLAQAARPAIPIQQAMDGFSRADENARENWEARRWSTPLSERLAASLADHTFLHVLGSGGTGKSFLLRELEGHLSQEATEREGRVVVAFRGHPGVALSSTMLLHQLYVNLEKTPLRAVLAPSGARIIPSATNVAAWWRELADVNPGTQIVILLDALEEMELDSGDPLDAIPSGDDRYRVVLATRRREEIPRSFAAAIGGAATGGRVFDLDAHYAGKEGEAELVRYLSKRHPRVKARQSDILEGARRGATIVFLRAFHLARGYEVGFQPEIRDGVPQWSYRRYLDWLEARVDGHPGYVRCLRSVLLTLADAPIPTSERVLLWQLDAPRRDTPTGVGPGFLDWLPWVLRDLEDFLGRRRLPPEPSTAADLWASQVAWFDARVCPVDASVLELGHADLRAYLCSDGVPPGWAALRDELRARRAARVREDLSGPNDGCRSSEDRFLMAFEGPRAIAMDSTDALLRAWLSRVPTHFVGESCGGFWVTALRNAVARDLPAAIRTDLQLRLGRALEADHASAEALSAFHVAVELARVEGGIAFGASKNGITKFARSSPVLARTLASALEAVGEHHAERNRRDGLPAVDEALALRRALSAGRPLDRGDAIALADTLALVAFAHTRTGSVMGMMWNGRGQPPDFQLIGQAAGIYAGHLHLHQPLVGEEIATAVARDPEGVAGLASVLACGIEVICSYNAMEVAMDIGRDAVACIDALVEAGDPRVRNPTYGRLRPLVRGLIRYATALQRADRHADALAVYARARARLEATLYDGGALDKTVARDLANLLLGFNERDLGLARAHRGLGDREGCLTTVASGSELLATLAGIPTLPSMSEITRAIETRPDAMKTLVVGMLEVPRILAPLGQTEECERALALLLQISRAWTGLDPTASPERRMTAAKNAPWAHRALSATLEWVARCGHRWGQMERAREALRECEALIRSAGLSTFPYFPDLVEPGDVIDAEGVMYIPDALSQLLGPTSGSPSNPRLAPSGEPWGKNDSDD